MITTEDINDNIKETLFFLEGNEQTTYIFCLQFDSIVGGN